VLSRGCAWLDAGTPDSLLQAATLRAKRFQSRTGNLVGVSRRGRVSAWAISQPTRCGGMPLDLGKTDLGRALMELAEGRARI